MFCLTFEPGSRFEQSLLQGTVEMKVESLVLCNIIPYSGQQNQVVKPLGHSFFQIGGEDSMTKAWKNIFHCTKLKYHNFLRLFKVINQLRAHLVAWYMAAAVQVSGSVKYRTCSQFASAGIILKAFGNLPLRYFDST